MAQSIDEMMQKAPVFDIGAVCRREKRSRDQARAGGSCILGGRRENDCGFCFQIDLTSSNMILQYGAGAQKKMADFSETALENVKTKDLGEVGKILTDVVSELREMDVDEEEKGIFGFFKKSGNKLANMKAKYEKGETNVEKICKELENHQLQLLKDIALLDKMYELNLTYFKELSMYIELAK